MVMVRSRCLENMGAVEISAIITHVTVFFTHTDMLRTIASQSYRCNRIANIWIRPSQIQISVPVLRDLTSQ